MTLLVRDPLFQRHETGRHPESPARLRSIEARLETAGPVVEAGATVLVAGTAVFGAPGGVAAAIARLREAALRASPRTTRRA